MEKEKWEEAVLHLAVNCWYHDWEESPKDIKIFLDFIRTQREQAKREGVEATIEAVQSMTALEIKEHTGSNLAKFLRSKLLNN